MPIDRERLARVCAKALTGGSLSSPKSIDHAAVTAVLADIAAQGFVIVPREPTEAMVEAYLETLQAQSAADYFEYRPRRAALSTLPQQAATDEGETGERRKLAELIDTHMLGVEPEDQCVVLDDDDWQRIIAALTADGAKS